MHVFRFGEIVELLYKIIQRFDVFLDFFEVPYDFSDFSDNISNSIVDGFSSLSYIKNTFFDVLMKTPITIATPEVNENKLKDKYDDIYNKLIEKLPVVESSRIIIQDFFDYIEKNIELDNEEIEELIIEKIEFYEIIKQENQEIIENELYFSENIDFTLHESSIGSDFTVIDFFGTPMLLDNNFFDIYPYILNLMSYMTSTREIILAIFSLLAIILFARYLLKRIPSLIGGFNSFVSDDSNNVTTIHVSDLPSGADRYAPND
ncbi:MAG: hypothetical protein FWF94_03015 [Oscillospiraceae bacterium]|nr:hypothetical protein [Oscillospiraceae bacterium]